MSESGIKSSAGVVRRTLRSTSARIAAFVTLLAITIAIYAPFLANDRPYVLVAVDIGAYESARTSLVPVARAWIELSQTSEAQWNARRPAHARQNLAEARALEENAIAQRLRTLHTYLDPRDRESNAVLAACESAFANAVSQRNSTEFENAALAVERELEPELRSPGAAPGAHRASLASATTYPVCASLSTFEATLATTWLALWIAWFALRSVRARVVCVVAVGAITALLWIPLARSGSRTSAVERESSSIKLDVERGDIVVERAWFPPLAMGQAETHMSEAYSPPSWLSGDRASSTSKSVRDSERAFAPRESAVAISRFEPAMSSPWRHLLGTDSLGRDLLARLVWGARASLVAGFASALLLTLIGVALGALAGWFGGAVDFLVSRTIEVVLCFPAFVLVMCAALFVDRSVVPALVAVTLLIGVFGWAGVARLVRAECLRLRELEFVMAARALGLTPVRILCRHVLPNAIQPAIIAFAFAVGAGILTESALSYLGIGVQVPTPSWGALVSDSKSPDHAWIWLFPGVCIFAVVASCNVLGEALRDTLDPRHER